MAHKRISFTDAVQELLSGGALEWPAFGDHKGGDAQISESGGRRVFQYLLTLDQTQFGDLSDETFDQIVSAWQREEDPATSVEAGPQSASSNEIWRLDKMETSGFGGLNAFNGPVFEHVFGSESWCLEGQNGSGKTSLVSAIIWAMTGYSIREHTGLVRDDGTRRPVYGVDGKKHGDWPPIATYPIDKASLFDDAVVWVRLTFRDSAGNRAWAYRRIKSPGLLGDTVERQIVDRRLMAFRQLIEVSLLMPNRLNSLGFGEKSSSLYEAVKILTGLDTFAVIAQAATALKRGNGKFLGYAKKNRIDDYENDFGNWIKKADEQSEITGYDLSPFEEINQKDLAETLREKANEANEEVGKRVEIISAEVGQGIDTKTQEGRDKVKSALSQAKGDITGTPRVPGGIFHALGTLSDAQKKNELLPLSSTLDGIDAELDTALEWHKKQVEDNKLRLKAVAAEWLSLPENAGMDGDILFCPLCESDLKTKAQIELGRELGLLRKEGETAQRRLVDICDTLRTRLSDALGGELVKARETLLGKEIKALILGEICGRFVDMQRYRDVLTGAASRVAQTLSESGDKLPSFESSIDSTSDRELPDPAKKVRDDVLRVRMLIALAEWWTENKGMYWQFWKETIGEPLNSDNSAEWPYSVIGAHLKELDESLTTARPYEETASSLRNAAEKADKWWKINTHQEMRKSIAEAISPLTQLGEFTNAQTGSSIADLSDRINRVLKRIHLHERLCYETTRLERESARKSTVNIQGGFVEDTTASPEYVIDATLVANTSWLRAILWAFIFALREEIVSGLGNNPLPLIVLDDPQATFDPRNEHLWAAELTRLATSSDQDQAQIILTTHETQFFKVLIEQLSFTDGHGRVVPIIKETGKILIESGAPMERLFVKAHSNNSDEDARHFIESLRVYVETALRYLLAGEGAQITSGLWADLSMKLKELNDAHRVPYDRAPFRDLANKLLVDTARVTKIQDAHHRHTQGVPDAVDIHDNFWRNIKWHLHQCFHIMTEYRVFRGDPNTFAINDNFIIPPSNQMEELKKIKLIDTGVAAAATTDGRVGDGEIELRQIANQSDIRLFNHDVFQLNSQTLEPVATVGDFLIVSNYARVRERNLVVAGNGSSLLARRYMSSSDHPYTAILTAQTIDPYGLMQPVLASASALSARKIVGTLFNPTGASPKIGNDEVAIVPDSSAYQHLLKNMSLFKVDGRSAEPIALDEQFLIAGNEVTTQTQIVELEGRFVIAKDKEGRLYFKRLRLGEGSLLILESLNVDGSTPSVIASLDERTRIEIVSVLPVTGVLFELPAAT